MKGFAECVDCHVWSEVPEGFKAIRHFVRCPKCQRAMYLVLSGTPQEVGLKVTQKVVGTLMLHGEKL